MPLGILSQDTDPIEDPCQPSPDSRVQPPVFIPGRGLFHKVSYQLLRLLLPSQ